MEWKNEKIDKWRKRAFIPSDHWKLQGTPLHMITVMDGDGRPRDNGFYTSGDCHGDCYGDSR